MTTILSIISALPGIITAIIELMKLAEEAYPGSGTGQSKKEMVMTAIQSMVNNQEFWDKVKNFFSKAIDFMAVFNFGSKA